MPSKKPSVESAFTAWRMYLSPVSGQEKPSRYRAFTVKLFSRPMFLRLALPLFR